METSTVLLTCAREMPGGQQPPRTTHYADLCYPAKQLWGFGRTEQLPGGADIAFYVCGTSKRRAVVTGRELSPRDAGDAYIYNDVCRPWRCPTGFVARPVVQGPRLLPWHGRMPMPRVTTPRRAARPLLNQEGSSPAESGGESSRGCGHGLDRSSIDMYASSEGRRRASAAVKATRLALVLALEGGEIAPGPAGKGPRQAHRTHDVHEKQGS